MAVSDKMLVYIVLWIRIYKRGSMSHVRSGLMQIVAKGILIEMTVLAILEAILMAIQPTEGIFYVGIINCFSTIVSIVALSM